MLERWLTGKVEEVEDLAGEIAELTDKFSGADLRSVVKQAISRADYQASPAHYP
jgi:SpoVK/Ycf46/Vps4 family AAA+-type ATPase